MACRRAAEGRVMSRTRWPRPFLAALAAALACAGVTIPLSAGPAGAAPPGGSTWKLAFADDFNGDKLDTKKWHTCHWWSSTTCSIETNNELELYTKRNVSVADGVLRLQARRESAVAWNGKTYGYTSGMVSTGGREGEIAPGFVYRYGYLEAKVKVPKGKGLWPALWTLPVNRGWPPEIDAMEILGDKPRETNMHYHYKRKADGGHVDVGKAWTGPDFSAGWHTFGVNWQPDAITWYVDGVERFRYTDRAYITSEPSYVLLNLAVGGNWPGSPNASTPFPSTYLVDWVRVYQKQSAAGAATAASADRTPPKVAIKGLRDGERIGRSRTVRAVASDKGKVVRMKLRVNGKLKATASGAKISFVWRSVPVGSHLVAVKAWDRAGNVSRKAVRVRR